MTIARAIQDCKRFVTNGGFQADIYLTPPGGYQIMVQGIATRHHNSIGTDGLPVNSTNTHISIIESSLNDENTFIRDSSGNVDLRNYIVECSLFECKKFIIKETMPDETLGLIVCILGDYNG